MCCICRSVGYSFDLIIWHICITIFCECVTWCKHCSIVVALRERVCLNNHFNLLNSLSDKRKSLKGWIHVGWEKCVRVHILCKGSFCWFAMIHSFCASWSCFSDLCSEGFVVQGRRISQLTLMNRNSTSLLRPFSAVLLFHCASLFLVKILPSSAQVSTSTAFLRHTF